jgi:uncharacterized protein DUF4167
MQHGPKIRPRLRRPATSSIERSTSRAVPAARNGSQSAQRNHERYLELARAEAQAGNPVGAENYYQHAEHYFRLMCPASEP